MSPKRRTEITNPELISLIQMLKKKAKENEAAVWLDVAAYLSKPKRERIAVNVSQISRHTEKNDNIVVPGKVLGAGLIGHPVEVAAFDFSAQARSKITGAKGKCLSIPDLIQLKPKGTNVRIIR